MNRYEPTDEQRAAWVSWCAERPPEIREVAERFPPWSLWLLNEQRVYPVGYSEPDPPKFPGVTLRVMVSGEYNFVMMEREVFGVDPASLTPADMPTPHEPVGSMDINAGEAARVMAMTPDEQRAWATEWLRRTFS